LKNKKIRKRNESGSITTDFAEIGIIKEHFV
jgi:hypothetical protein